MLDRRKACPGWAQTPTSGFGCSVVAVELHAQLNALAIQNALDIFVDTPIARRYEQTWIHGWYFNPIYQNANTTYYYALSKGQ